MIQRYAQLWFLEKGLRIFSLSHLAYDFSRKLCLSDSIQWPDFIVWLALLLEILQLFHRLWGHKFEINLVFLIKPFSYMTKKSRQKFWNIWRMKGAFNVKWKAFFIISFSKCFQLPKLSQTWDCVFKCWLIFLSFFCPLLLISARKSCNLFVDVKHFDHE